MTINPAWSSCLQHLNYSVVKTQSRLTLPCYLRNTNDEQVSGFSDFSLSGKYRSPLKGFSQAACLKSTFFFGSYALAWSHMALRLACLNPCSSLLLYGGWGGAGKSQFPYSGLFLLWQKTFTGSMSPGDTWKLPPDICWKDTNLNPLSQFPAWFSSMAMLSKGLHARRICVSAEWFKR